MHLVREETRILSGGRVGKEHERKKKKTDRPRKRNILKFKTKLIHENKAIIY